MAGPVGELPRNIARELDAALNDDSGWDFFKERFLPAAVADSFRPPDELLVDLARYAETDRGRRVVDWLLDLTANAPYPVTGHSIQHTALAAAKHEGRAGVGATIKKALREGRRLIEADHKRRTEP